MTDTPNGFDPDTVETVADHHGLDSDCLAEAISHHQRLARPSRSVDDIVYEYRRAYSPDPLVARTPGWYALAVPDHVWPEFLAAMGVDADLATALQEVHRRTFETLAGENVPEDRDALVFVRSDED